MERVISGILVAIDCAGGLVRISAFAGSPHSNRPSPKLSCLTPAPMPDRDDR